MIKIGKSYAIIGNIEIDHARESPFWKLRLIRRWVYTDNDVKQNIGEVTGVYIPGFRIFWR